MQPARELSPETWDEYFDAVSRELIDAQVLVELDGGRPLAATELSLLALTYDPHGETLEVALSDREQSSLLHHLVRKPRRVSIDNQTLLAPLEIAVEAGDGSRTLLRFERDLESAEFS